MMKILETGYTVPQSGVLGTSLGISRYTYYMAYYFRKFGHDVELFIRNDYKPDEVWIKTVTAPKSNWIAYPFFLSNIIKNLNADVYFADYPSTGLPFVWNKKSPSVVTIHDVIPLENDPNKMKPKNRIINKWYRYCFDQIKNADALIVRSNTEKKNALNFLPEEKIKVVFGGVDLKVYKPTKRKENKKLRIGYIGGLDGRKNSELLVKAFAELSKDRNDIELHVAGGGKNLERFKAMNIPNAKFYGFIPEDNTVSFLNSLDIFVYPTLREGLGLAPIEAMACGLPVIVCNATTMPEVVGKSGMIVDTNIESMKVGIGKMVDSKRLRLTYRSRGLKRAKALTWESAAKQAIKILEGVRK